MRSRPTYSAEYVSARKQVRPRRRFPLWRSLALLLVLGLAFKEIRDLTRSPQAVLVLGGAKEREKFAAQFAQEHSDLPVWVSSGSNPEYSEWVFAEAGIDPSRVHRDYQAVDTVTNFTTLADDFKARGITSVYLITSDYHMRRAWVIGEIVLGSRGIDFKPVEVPSAQSSEALAKTLRDGARAILWVVTGDTGLALAKYFE